MSPSCFSSYWYSSIKRSSLRLAHTRRTKTKREKTSQKSPSNKKISQRILLFSSELILSILQVANKVANINRTKENDSPIQINSKSGISKRRFPKYFIDRIWFGIKVVKMSGAFFFEHIVEAVLNLEQQSKAKQNETKSSQAESVKKPKKK